jgi:hypothetical protein
MKNVLRLRASRAKHTGLLTLAVTFSAGIHAALVPEHLEEMPRLGYAFIGAAVIGAVLAAALVSRPRDRRLPLVAAVFCLGQIGAWALFVTLPVPGFSGTPESVENIALVSKAVEAVGVVLALPLITLPVLRRPQRSRRPRPVFEDAQRSLGINARRQESLVAGTAIQDRRT